jgi:hypothetical protein
MEKNCRILWLVEGLVVLISLVVISLPLIAQEKQKKELSPAKRYQVKETLSKIKIDGRMGPGEWKDAALIRTFYEWTPGDNTPPPVETECYVTFSKSFLYIAFKCLDPNPKKIRAHLMDRDAIDTFIQDDHVNFQIDPFNDERRGFQFRINPLGVQADAIFSEMEGYEDFSWDAIWKSAGKITEFGYVVEVAIPFNQLRFPRTKDIQTWGFGAERSYPRNVRHRMTSYARNRNIRCFICQHNKIIGLQGMSPGRNLEFDPTLTINKTDQRENFPDGEIKNGDFKFKPGITARWGITPNLILNATINPDFSNVEADVAQLEVNTRFALRYAEKRPFFLEGADFFLTPMEAVFTRTVFDPLWGVKTTGKLGKNALGVFITQDRYNNLLFPSNQGSAQTSMEEDVFSGVVRFRRDVGKGSTVGALYTGRTSNDYSNHVMGADAFFRLSQTKTFNVQFLHSRTDYSDETAQAYGQKADAFNGNGLFAQFSHFGRNWLYGASYEDLSNDFRADYGFIPRVNYRKLNSYFQTVLWGKQGDWFNRISFRLEAERVTDQDGNKTDQYIRLASTYQGPFQTVFQPSFKVKEELYNGINFKQTQFRAYLELKPVGGLKLFLYSEFGDSIDYSNTRLAKSALINSNIELSIGKHLNINLDHIFEKLSFKGNKIYTANLLQARFIYNFSVRTFVRAILQYTNIDRDTKLYNSPIDPKTKALFSQFLFSYKINPQTVLFLGYSDNYFGLQNIDLTQTDRTFFLKIGYALIL